MADRLYTSQQTEEILNSLRFETKIGIAVLARIAFMLSIIENGDRVKNSSDYSGNEIKRPTFFANDETFIKALIRFVYDGIDLEEEDLYSNKSVIKNHIDCGALLLSKIFIECNHNCDILFQKLAIITTNSLAKTPLGKDLDIFIGKNILSNESIVLELNNSRKHANSHLAIMGKPGVGKTQLLLKILTDIRIQSKFLTHFILFDYKGDVVTNSNFTDITRATTYRLLTNNETLPINPFVLPDYDEQSVLVSAREKAESFASINSKLGVVQKGSLTEAIRAAYAKRELTETPYPDFQEILTTVKQMYQEEDKKDDSLIEVLRDLADFNLFWSHGSESAPLDSLSNKSMIIDVHSMPVLKELVCYLVIERLYKEMAALPDSPIKNGRRTIRTILAIDEAHNYLPQKNIFLQRIIREGRSKGIFVFFASQSPNDYQQQFFNFQELLEFAFIFQADGISAKAIQDILGCSSNTAKDLQVEIARLEPFQVISRGMSKDEEFMKFSAEAFYKHY